MNWETFSVLFLLISTHYGLAEEIFEMRTFGENKKCLAVEPGKIIDGAAIVLLPCISSEPNFQWYRTPSKLDHEYFNILTKKVDNKCLSVPAFNTANRAGLIQWNCENTENQRWKFMASDISRNVIYLKNKFSGKCVAVNDENLTDGSKIVQWDCDDRYNQQLYLLPPIRTKILKDGTTTELRTFGEQGKCFSVADALKTDGAPIVLFPCGTAGYNAQWHPIKSKAEPEHYNVFTNNTHNKCLTVPTGNTRNGASLQQWNCGDSPNQQWKFEESARSPNVVYLINKFSGKCATVNAGNLRNGAGIVQWNCLGRYNQQLYLPATADQLDSGAGAAKAVPPAVPIEKMEVRMFVDRKKCWAVAGGKQNDGASIYVSSCSEGEPRYQWYKIPSKSEPGYFNILTKNVANKCLTLPKNGTTVAGDALEQWTCVDSPIQQWKLIESDLPSGAVSLVNKFSGQCASALDLSSSFTRLTQGECLKGQNQQFFFHT